MTLICSHRVNEPTALDALDLRYGVEMDLRSEGGRLILVHDAFTDGPDFEDWLAHYRHRFIVLNTKEEGLETRIEEALARAGVTEWAYLDQSFPFLVRTLKRGETRTMVRVSEYESVQTALALQPRPQWVWLDSFTGAWPEAAELRLLAEHGFSIMVVSPELQGRDLESEFEVITARFTEAGVPLHGVCTKKPAVWDRPEAEWWAA
ncbi:hypothetical protein [Herbiconiux sp. YIM B11900]|uniref:hypothetical protein n=1 Tax=Herbiconiux sp. YIM B11900 TaxID=3404131 RepID=UPI003F84A2AE